MLVVDAEMKKRAMARVLEEIEKAMDEVDARRMSRSLSESMDENSEEPIDPGNLDPAHSEAEDEGGHPGSLAAADVDSSEEKGEEDEDKRRLKGLLAAKSK